MLAVGTADEPETNGPANLKAVATQIEHQRGRIAAFDVYTKR